MTTRNLDALFAPHSVAFVGASSKPGSVGAMVSHNLLTGGFAGPIWLVNPHETEVEGHAVFRSIADLPGAPDLAVIATPAETAPTLVSELGMRGCRAAVVISAGFEGPGRAAELRQAVLDAARPHLLRIVGPNCLGLLSPSIGLNASFARAMPPRGGVALIAQSGAVAAAAMDAAPAIGLGFSDVVTVGDCVDVDVADLLDELALAPSTRAILLYLEGITDGRKFMSAARIAARAKPVVVLKAGRSAAGARAALTHTGALAGGAEVYSAAFRRAGLVEVQSLGDLLRAGVAFNAYASCGPGLAILTNGGGAGVLAADAMAALGEQAVELSPATLAALDRVAPPNWSRRDPVDILGDAHPELYGRALAILLGAREVEAVLVANAPTAVGDSTAAAEAVIAAAQAHPRKPVVTAWLGGENAIPARKAFAKAGIPSYENPEDAVTAVHLLSRARQARRGVRRAPAAAAAPARADEARRIVDSAVGEGRNLLTDPESRAVLQAYGVATVASATAANPAEAAQAAGRIGGQVALKILSPDISHKTDVGGVRLGLSGSTEVRAAAEAMLTRVSTARPSARIDGFTVEPMIARPKGQEVLAGLVQDATFGPVVLIAEGGVAAEVRADRALGLPPLDRELAREMIGRTRVSKLLAGYRDRPAADVDALADVLVALGRLAADIPEIVELDINPLLCDASGALALDARIGVRRVDGQTPRLAILPYPADLVRPAVVAGEGLRLRPIRPDDGQRLSEMIDLCTPGDVHLRFGGGMRRLPDELEIRLTQLDYDRQMAFAAERADGAFLGVGRLVSDPDGRRAEFALMVRSDWQHRGLGRLLLATVIDYARTRGLEEVWGDVARDNDRMRDLAGWLGFMANDAGDPARVIMTLNLSHALTTV